MTHTPPASVPAVGTASSIGLAPLLQGPARAGQLLGASHAALYLRFDVPPGVLALLPRSSVRLPIGMVVPGGLPAVDADAPIVAGEGVLRVGTDAWLPARWFDPRPANLGSMDAARVAAAVDLVHKLARSDFGVPASRARGAVGALVAGDAEPVCALIGSGPGLTPAGDDVVAGALAACALFARQAGLDAAPEILRHARTATTSLSSALLSCAAAGQVVPEAARFFAALCGTGSLAAGLAGLRSVGTTSGTALALGIVSALEGWEDGAR